MKHGALQGHAARRQAHSALPPVSSGRLRPGSLIRFAFISRAARSPRAVTQAVMDTQRLILFVIFSFSALLLWEAWQKESRPPPPAGRVDARRSRRPRPTCRRARGRAAGAAAGAGVAGAPPSGAGAAARAPPAQTITITTDLYRAEIDTTGGVITQVALAQASRSGRRGEALPRAAAGRRSARSSRRRGCSARACRTTARVYEALPGPRELAPGADRVELQLAGDRAERRQGRAGADVPSRQLRDRRRLRHHQHRRRADRAVRVFPADARHEDAGRAELDGAGRRTSGPVIYNETDKFKKVEFGELDKLAADPSRKLPYTKNADNGWVGDGRALLRRRVAAGGREEDRRASSTRASSTAASTRPGVIVPVGTIAPGATGEVRVPLYVGPQEQDELAKARQGPRPRRRLRHLHGDRGAALLAAQVAARHRRQLGLGDRAADDHHQERVLSAEPRERALDGEDEGDRAEAEGAAGAVRERQAAAADQDDGDVQAGEDQPAGRLPADPGADPGVHRALLGAARRRSSCATRRGSAGSRTSRRRIRTSCCRSSTRSPRICR